MKIYTRVVWQWQPDGSLVKVPEECESFDYEGPIALCKDSPSPPPAPNYQGAAEATAAGNLEAAQYATNANRINQYTPYGNLTYSRSPSSFSPEDPRYGGQMDPGGKWESNLSLAPDAQATLDSQMAVSRNLGNLTQQQLGRVNQQYSQPMDLSSVGQVADKAYGAMTSRLDPMWQQREEQERARLANQGVVSGGEAYGNAMREFNQARNDAYQQANLGAISTMPQTYQLASSIYQQPLNQLNAIRTGAQIQNPTFNAPGMQQTTPGANYLGAAQAQGQYDQGLYNADVGQQNAMMGGLFSLGSAALGSPWLPGAVMGARKVFG